MTDAEIDTVARHKHFISNSTKEGRYGYKKVERLTGEFDAGDGIRLLQRSHEKLLDKKVSLYPEYIAYTIGLEGCPRQLLDYLLFYELREDGRYRFNKQTIGRFQRFVSSLGARQYTESTIKKAHRTLVDMNLTLNVDRGVYMMNPMVYDPGSQDLRRMRINEYSRHLLDDGKDTTLQFYPRIAA